MVVVLLYGLFGNADTIAYALISVIVLGLIGIAVFYALAKLLRVEETELIRGLVRRLTRRTAGKRV